ncbi:hypothetical protein C8F04DRAFT_1195509 [Mycena alexandri]|uniref:Uncharacterized protein n=1 Tax=Mycena alexandri TaxID=1745969 RepID=A0AAD6S570_9AGAR|nr:hypothetical protein C8F04DRAFT_1195509 [Mycena alexandri]
MANNAYTPSRANPTPSKEFQQPTLRSTRSPHRPAPQVLTKNVDRPPSPNNKEVLSVPPEVTSSLGVPRAKARRNGGRGMRGGAHAKAPSTKETRKVSAKREKYESLLEDTSSVNSLAGLAAILDDTIQTMNAHNAAPTKACMALLSAIQERLANHHEFPALDPAKKLGF